MPPSRFDEVPTPQLPSPWRRFLYWLSGNRAESLVHQPDTEQDRIAIFGYAILVPTLMAFGGMLFYLRRRWDADELLPLQVAVSVVWAFVIMSVDRILIATYRPFDPLSRRIAQITARVALAAFLSGVIALPFCLDLYAGAIDEKHRALLAEKQKDLRSQHDGRIADVDERVRTELERIEAEVARYSKSARAAATAEEWEDLEILRWRSERRDAVVRSAPALVGLRREEAQLERRRADLSTRRERLERRRAELETALQLEVDGKETHTEVHRFPGWTAAAGHKGRAQKIKDWMNEAAASAREAASDLVQIENDLASLAQRIGHAKAELADTAEQEQRARLREVAETRVLTARRELEVLSNARTVALERQRLIREVARSDFPMLYAPPAPPDPLDATIALSEVIAERAEEGGWFFAVAQLLLVMGALFMVDLIPLLSKTMSRGGPHDAFVHIQEQVAIDNARALIRNYHEAAQSWTANEFSPYGDRTALPEPGPSTADTPALTDMILRVHRPSQNKDLENFVLGPDDPSFAAAPIADSAARGGGYARADNEPELADELSGHTFPGDERAT